VPGIGEHGVARVELGLPPEFEAATRLAPEQRVRRRDDGRPRAVVETGKKKGQFYFQGDGWADVRLEKGGLLSQCAKVCVGVSRWKKCWSACVHFSPSNMRVGGARGHIDMDQATLTIDFMGISRTAIWDFASNTLSTKALAGAATITSEQFAAAQALGQPVAAATYRLRARHER
jgi:hypothetical protein